MLNKLFGYNKEKHTISNKYYSLAILLTLVLLYPFWFTAIPQGRVILGILFTSISFLAVYSATSTQKQLLLGIILLIPSVLLEWLSVFNGAYFALSARLIMYTLFFAFLFFRIFIQLFKANEVDEKLMAATVVNFLILGLLGSMLTQFVVRIDSNAFHGITADTLEDYSFFYYSFITLTSVGYGDIYPVTSEARSLAVFLSISGQTYFTIIVALIVGKYLNTH